MHSSLAMPHYGVYVDAAFVTWIIVQAVTGKFAYKRSKLRRQNNPGAFWFALGIETALIVPVICFQFGWNNLGVVLAAVLEIGSLGGFLVWGAISLILWVIARSQGLHRDATKEFQKID